MDCRLRGMTCREDGFLGHALAGAGTARKDMCTGLTFRCFDIVRGQSILCHYFPWLSSSDCSS